MTWNSVEEMYADSELFEERVGSLPTVDQLVRFAEHKRDEVSPEGIFEVVMLDVLRAPLEEWLTSMRLRLVPIPTESGAIRAFTTTPTDKLIRDTQPLPVD